jgi:hypothetical protein
VFPDPTCPRWRKLGLVLRVVPGARPPGPRLVTALLLPCSATAARDRVASPGSACRGAGADHPRHCADLDVGRPTDPGARGPRGGGAGFEPGVSHRRRRLRSFPRHDDPLVAEIAGGSRSRPNRPPVAGVDITNVAPCRFAEALLTFFIRPGIAAGRLHWCRSWRCHPDAAVMLIVRNAELVWPRAGTPRCRSATMPSCCATARAARVGAPALRTAARPKQ